MSPGFFRGRLWQLPGLCKSGLRSLSHFCFIENHKTEGNQLHLWKDGIAYADRKGRNWWQPQRDSSGPGEAAPGWSSEKSLGDIWVKKKRWFQVAEAAWAMMTVKWKPVGEREHNVIGNCKKLRMANMWHSNPEWNMSSGCKVNRVPTTENGIHSARALGLTEDLGTRTIDVCCWWV